MRQRKGTLRPRSCMQETIRSDQTPARHQHQRTRRIRHVFREHVRRVRHANAMRAAPIDWHTIIADAKHADDLQLRQLLQQCHR